MDTPAPPTRPPRAKRSTMDVHSITNNATPPAPPSATLTPAAARRAAKKAAEAAAAARERFQSASRTADMFLGGGQAPKPWLEAQQKTRSEEPQEPRKSRRRRARRVIDDDDDDESVGPARSAPAAREADEAMRLNRVARNSMRGAQAEPQKARDWRARKVIDDDEDDDDGANALSTPAARKAGEAQSLDQVAPVVQREPQKSRDRRSWRVIDDDEDDYGGAAAAPCASAAHKASEPQRQDEGTQNGLRIVQESLRSRRGQSAWVVDDDDATPAPSSPPNSGPSLPSPASSSFEAADATADAGTGSDSGAAMEDPDAVYSPDTLQDIDVTKILSNIDKSLEYSRNSLLPSPALTAGTAAEAAAELPSPQGADSPMGGGRDEDGLTIWFDYEDNGGMSLAEHETSPEDEAVPEGELAVAQEPAVVQEPANEEEPGAEEHSSIEQPYEGCSPKRLAIDESAAASQAGPSPRLAKSEARNERGKSALAQEEEPAGGPSPKRARPDDGAVRPLPSASPHRLHDERNGDAPVPDEDAGEGRSPKRLRLQDGATEALPRPEPIDGMQEFQAVSPASRESRNPFNHRPMQLNVVGAAREESSGSSSGPSTPNSESASAEPRSNNPEREKENQFLLQVVAGKRSGNVLYDLDRYCEGLQHINATYPELRIKWQLVMELLDAAVENRDFLFLFIIQTFSRLDMILSSRALLLGVLESFGNPDDVRASMRRLGNILKIEPISLAAQHALAALPLPIEVMASGNPEAFRDMRSLTSILLKRLTGFDRVLTRCRLRRYPPLPRETVLELGCASSTLARPLFRSTLWVTWGLSGHGAMGWLSARVEYALQLERSLWDVFLQRHWSPGDMRSAEKRHIELYEMLAEQVAAQVGGVYFDFISAVSRQLFGIHHVLHAYQAIQIAVAFIRPPRQY